MSEDVQTRSRVTGSLGSADGRGSVRMEDRYDTDIADLWSALTDPARLARWLGEFGGDLRVGGAISARFTSSWEGTGRIDVCESPRHLLLTMSAADEDDTVIEAWLAEDGDRTALVIEERGLPLPGVAAYGAGWQAHVEDLAAHLQGRPAADWLTRWKELSPAYEEQERRLA